MFKAAELIDSSVEIHRALSAVTEAVPASDHVDDELVDLLLINWSEGERDIH